MYKICKQCFHHRENEEGIWCNRFKFPTLIAKKVDDDFVLTQIGKQIKENRCEYFQGGGNGGC